MDMLHLLFLFAITLTTNAVDVNLDEDWKNFKNKFNKTYSQAEELKRRPIWEKHVLEILHHNLEADLGIHGYTLGINEYLDMTHEEFTKTLNGHRKENVKNDTAEVFRATENLILPEAVDWRKEGMVTHVKNQGQCGSCWSFTSTGALEGQHKKMNGILVSLSEQNLIDCSGPQGNLGCDGGWAGGAYLYVANNSGIDSEASYPYRAENGVCQYQKRNKAATCTGYKRVYPKDESALQEALATIGPIAVAADSSLPSFAAYRSGVYDDPLCTENVDHAMLAVGYGSENGKDYWLIKNSWGPSWGEDGYIKMVRNKNNHCGIALQMFYPIVEPDPVMSLGPNPVRNGCCVCLTALVLSLSWNRWP